MCSTNSTKSIDRYHAALQDHVFNAVVVWSDSYRQILNRRKTNSKLTGGAAEPSAKKRADGAFFYG